MANPLARVVMNNIAQRSGKVDAKPNLSRHNSGTFNLDNKEEQLLKSIGGRNARNVTSNQRLATLDSLSGIKPNNNASPKTDDVAKVRNNPVTKINLEDLVKSNNRVEQKRNTTTQKSNTMTTLNDLAGKIKKNSEINSSVVQESKSQNNNTSNYVRTGVINNLEAYIPKVSLDSIGKKGSLLK